MGTVGDWMGHCSCFMIYNGDEWVRFTRTIHGDSAGDIFMVINRHVYHEILSDYDWVYNEIIVGYFMGQWRIEPASQGDYNWFTKNKKPHKKKLWKKRDLLQPTIATSEVNRTGPKRWSMAPKIRGWTPGKTGGPNSWIWHQIRQTMTTLVDPWVDQFTSVVFGNPCIDNIDILR